MPNNIRLYDAILAFQSSVNSPSFQQGRVLVSTSGNGQAASFELGNTREYTPEAIFALSEQLFDVLAFALANNPTLSDNATEANTRAIFAVMVDDDRLQTVTKRGTDWTLLNFPQTGQLATTGG